MTGGVQVYREGFLHGAIQSLRFNTTLTFGCFIIWSTQPRDLLLAFVKLRVPYNLAFMVTTSLHYIPLITAESRNVILSQRLRGFRYLQFNLLAVIRGLLNSFRPILTNNIRRSTHLGEAVESRAFSPDIVGKQRTYLRSLKMQPQDIALITAGSIIPRRCHYAEDTLFLLREWNLLRLLDERRVYVCARGIIVDSR